MITDRFRLSRARRGRAEPAGAGAPAEPVDAPPVAFLPSPATTPPVDSFRGPYGKPAIFQVNNNDYLYV
jgi:hypothetical protein